MKIIWVLAITTILAAGQVFAGDADKTVTFDVEKMTCATCPIAVKKAMLRVDGVNKVEVNFKNKSAIVTFDSSMTTSTEIGQSSTDVGFPATVKGSE